MTTIVNNPNNAEGSGNGMLVGVVILVVIVVLLLVFARPLLRSTGTGNTPSGAPAPTTGSTGNAPSAAPMNTGNNNVGPSSQPAY